ncbi:MAG: glycosyltransferase [Phycisphaerae bacterium]
MSGGRISIVIPTRDRQAVLAGTLERVSRLVEPGDEIIVVDNGSTDGTVEQLAPRFAGVQWIELGQNLSCAARNVGAAAAQGELLLMLDDDSWPAPETLPGLREAFAADSGLGAVACRIRRADDPRRHDVGGLAGVIVNCGAGIRREPFLDAGGYPFDFDYYVEEYDLCCRLWLRGWRVEPRGDLAVWHSRTGVNRDSNRMLRCLVRNNLRVWERYAPAERRERLLAEMRDRYAQVARRESAEAGYAAGLAEWSQMVRRGGPRLSERAFGEMFGLGVARQRLAAEMASRGWRRVGVWGRGKGCPQLLELLTELGIEVAGVYEPGAADESWFGARLRAASALGTDGVDALIPGTLSLGAASDESQVLAERFSDTPIFAALDWNAFAPELTTTA